MLHLMQWDLMHGDDTRYRAAHKGETAGKVLSELARRGLQHRCGKVRRKMVHGFEVLPAQGRVITPQLVQRDIRKIRGRVIALPDINMLIALFDAAHVHHRDAYGWDGKESAPGLGDMSVKNADFMIFTRGSSRRR